MNKRVDHMPEHLAALLSPLVSVVVPVFNEKAVLPVFFDRVLPILDGLKQRWELVFVDDGSTDGTSALICAQMQTTHGIRLIRLSRNFGKEAAVTAGLTHARGDAVIVMDVDLQDPPEHVPQMIQRWLSGADVVLMQRRSRRGESLAKRLSAHAFYRLLSRVSRTDIPRDTGDFRLMSRRAVNAVLQLPERNRYMKGLFAWIGMPTQVIAYDRPPRAAGETRWDYPGLVGLALEGLTSFSITPLRWAMLAGLVAATLGGLFGAWIVLKALLLSDPTSGYPSLVAMMTFLGGIQLLSIGILGEYVGKTYLETKQRPIFIGEEVTADGFATSSNPAMMRGERHAVTH